MSIHYPYILISEGKHTNDHYLIQCEDDIAKASVEILRDWDEWQFLQPYDPYFSSEEKEFMKAGITEEQILAMPEPLRKKPLKTLRKIETEKAQYEKDKRYYELVRQVLDAPKEEAWKMLTPKGGNLANALRRLRQGSEYQEISEERVTVFDREGE